MKPKLRLTQIRKQRRLSMTRLSKLSGVARGYISNIESGRYDNPTLKIICSLCRALNCTPNDIIDCGGDEDEDNSFERRD